MAKGMGGHCSYKAIVTHLQRPEEELVISSFTAQYGGYCKNASECLCKDGFNGTNCDIRKR